MIAYVLGIFVCWTPMNCEWRTVGSFLNEGDCHSIGIDYAKDATVIRYKCIIGMTDAEFPSWQRPVRRP